MPLLTALKHPLTVLKRFLTSLKLSPTLPFTRYLFALLKLTSLAGVTTICAFVVYVMVHLAVSPAYRVSTLRLFGFDNTADV